MFTRMLLINIHSHIQYLIYINTHIIHKYTYTCTNIHQYVHIYVLDDRFMDYSKISAMNATAFAPLRNLTYL